MQFSAWQTLISSIRYNLLEDDVQFAAGAMTGLAMLILTARFLQMAC